MTKLKEERNRSMSCQCFQGSGTFLSPFRVAILQDVACHGAAVQVSFLRCEGSSTPTTGTRMSPILDGSAFLNSTRLLNSYAQTRQPHLFPVATLETLP